MAALNFILALYREIVLWLHKDCASRAWAILVRNRFPLDRACLDAFFLRTNTFDRIVDFRITCTKTINSDIGRSIRRLVE